MSSQRPVREICRVLLSKTRHRMYPFYTDSLSVRWSQSLTINLKNTVLGTGDSENVHDTRHARRDL